MAEATQAAGWQTFRKKSCLFSHPCQARKVMPPTGVSRQAEETGRTLIPAFARRVYIDTSSTTFPPQRAPILFSSKLRLLMAVAPPHGWRNGFYSLHQMNGHNRHEHPQGWQSAIPGNDAVKSSGHNRFA